MLGIIITNGKAYYNYINVQEHEAVVEDLRTESRRGEKGS